MFFNADDDEQDFLSSSGGSKLASLFGVDKASNQGGNESLKYTAPKQPRKETPSQSGGGTAAVTFATAVHAYKYVDGQYASQGKLGAAILGNLASQDYRILLYVSKQQQVTNVRISPSFVFTIQANNYASFYDEARQSWSLMFDSEENSEKFAKHVGLAKANSSATALDSVMTQDLHLGDGGALETGDLVEVKYTGWLLTNGTFGQEFDSNVKTDKQFKFKIGKGKVIKGWDAGVVGMKKGSKRLLVVPPSLGYGSQGAGNKIPPNSTLIFEVSVVRVKLAKAESPKPSPAPTPEPVPSHNATPSPAPSEPELDDSTIKARTKSITEHMTHQGGGKSGKANLISRMAKMGKPMLPLQGAVAADPESDEEPVPESPEPVAVTAAPVQAPHQPATRPPVVAKPVPQQPMAAPVDYSQSAAPVATNPMMHQPSFAPPAGQQMALYQSPQSLLQQQQAAFLQQQQLQQQAAFQPPVSSTFPVGTYPGAPTFPNGTTAVNQPDAATPMLLTETRQQNTELRLAVGKMADKVDTVLQKVEHLQTQQSGALAVQSSAPNMEASVLMHNVQRIVQENERLRKEGYEKSSRIDAQNNKISELLQSNQMFVEKSQTLLEQRNEGFKATATTSQAKVLALEQEKVQLATELSTATSQLGTLQLEIAGMRKKEMELQQKLGSSSNDFKKNSEELESLQLQHTEDEERIKNLTAGLREEKQRRKEGENKLSQLTEELADLRVTTESLQKNLTERKKKAAEERRKMEEDMEDSKLQFEQEIQNLREKLRRQKNSTDAAKAEQVTKLEEEIGEEWKAKSEKQLAAAQERHARALQSMKEEKEELEQKVTELELKIRSLKQSSGGSEERVRALQDQVDELSDWKTKYDSLRDQASSMRDKYETRISELEEERDSLVSQHEQLSQRVAALQKQGTSAVPPGGNESVVTEVKKIMNSVYQQLRGQFSAEESYSGADVLTAILGAIKTTTLKLVQQSSQAPPADQEEEEDEEEDEEELEDSEEEEEEDDKESLNPTTQTEPPAEKETASVVQSTEKQDTPQESEESDDFDDEEETQEDLPEVPVVTEDKPENPAVDPPSQPTQESSNSVDSTKGADNSNEQDSGDSTQRVDNSSEQQNSEPVMEQSVKESLPETNHIAADISEPVKKESESSEVIPAASRTPPPLLDDEEEEDTGDKPLFGEDDTVEDTLGISFKPKTDADNKDDKGKKDKKMPTKADLENDEDLKPQPPPPLFGDDDDDDDLDWLS